MKKVKKYIRKLRLSFTKYIYTNRLFITYLILSIIGTIILRDVTRNTGLTFKPFMTDLGLIFIIGAFGYLMKPKNQFKYYFIWIILFTVLEVVNSVYYTFYNDFGSVALLASLSQTETVMDSIFAQLRLVDFIYILEPLTFYYIHKHLKISSYYNLMAKIEKGRKSFLFSILIGFVCLVYSFATATGTDYSRLSKQWNRAYIVERFGIILYQFNDVFQTITPRITSLFGREEAMQMVNSYFEQRPKYNDENKYTGVLEGYNIVYVHMESMQSLLMDLEFNGEPLAPNLINLSQEGMYFSNFYSPVSTGTSSDAEYMMLTGMLPSSSGTVFVTYSDNTFYSLPKYLKDKGYFTFSMHGNYASMWNRSNIHPNLGYQEMFFRDTFEFDPDTDSIGLGINDKLFFKQAVEKLETIENTYDKYFGTIITLSNHSPFAPNEAFTYDINDYYVDPETNEDTSSCYLCDRDIGKYLVSSHYADEALGEFLEYIKNSDKFDNTLFVFYGDHDAKISYKEMNYLYNYDYLTGELKDEESKDYKVYDNYDYNIGKKVPLIFWTKNKELSKKLNGEVNTVMAMYDVAPTLYNMLNIDGKYALGHDIFNIGDDNIVIYPNGNFISSKVYYNNSTGEYKVFDENNAILDADYITNKVSYVEELLGVNNAIIQYNIFAKDKKDNKK